MICFQNPRMRFSSKSGRILRGDSSPPAPGAKPTVRRSLGFVPIKDAKVAEKLAAEILLVTRDYPALFDLADEFAPFRKVMIETFCQMIENGETYLQA